MAEVLSEYKAATSMSDESTASADKRAAGNKYNEYLVEGIMLDKTAREIQKRIDKGDKNAVSELEEHKQKRKAEIFNVYGVPITAATKPPPVKEEIKLPPIHKTPDGQTLYLHPDGRYYTNKPK
jgi:hypothetical protein